MATRRLRSGAGGAGGRQQIIALQEQLARLATVVEDQRQQLGAQQAEIAALRSAQGTPATQRLTSKAQRTSATGRRTASAAAGRASSRRALLKWGGAAAAAATVAMVASEQHDARAASANDGSNLVLGSVNNYATSETDMWANSGSSANQLLRVDVSNSTFVPPAGSLGPSAIHGEASPSGTSASTATGVAGTSTNGVGVYGLTTSGIGVYGDSASGVSIVAAGMGRIWQFTQGSAGAPTSGSYNAGEQIRDSVGNLIICVASGSPGTWQQVIAAGGSARASGTTSLTGTSGNTLAVTGPDDVYGVHSTVGGSEGVGVGGFAIGPGSIGVLGESDSGYGVVGAVNTGIALATGGTNRFAQGLQTYVGAPTSGTYNAGEQIRDKNGELWLCVAGGAPGTWVMASHAVAGYSGGAISYLNQSIRLLDTRGGDDLAKVDTGGPISPGSPYPVPIANVNWQGVQVPANAVGAIGNVTAVATPSGGGYLALVPHGTPFSGTALFAFSANQIVSNSFNVGLSGGQLDIIVGGSNPTDVVLDLFAVIA